MEQINRSGAFLCSYAESSEEGRNYRNYNNHRWYIYIIENTRNFTTVHGELNKAGKNRLYTNS